MDNATMVVKNGSKKENVVRMLRGLTRLSRKEFGERTGIPVRTLSHWEIGDHTPPPYVVKLLKHFVLTYGYLE